MNRPFERMTFARRCDQPREAWENPVHYLLVFLTLFDQVSFWILVMIGAAVSILLGWLAQVVASTGLPFWSILLSLWFFVTLDAIALALLARLKLSFGPLNSVWISLFVARWIVVLSGLMLSSLLWPAYPLVTWFGLIIPQALLTFVVIWSTYIEPFALQVTRVQIVLPNLSPGESLRIVHLSDIHLEQMTKRERAVLEIVRETDPDYIFLTGDYLNLSNINDEESISQFNEWVHGLQARRGIYAVPGGPPVEVSDLARRLFAGSPVQLLEDEVTFLDNSNVRIQIMGIVCSRDKEKDSVTFRNLVNQVRTDLATILLYHTPDLMPTVSQSDKVDIYLAGHTHGGQLCLPFYGALFTCSDYGKLYEAGLYHNRRTSLYVNRGIGLEGLSAPRARFFSRPEITVLTITGIS